MILSLQGGETTTILSLSHTQQRENNDGLKGRQHENSTKAVVCFLSAPFFFFSLGVYYILNSRVVVKEKNKQLSKEKTYLICV